MTARPRNITFDCTDPYRLAGFWSAVTGYREDPDNGNAPADPEALLVGQDGQPNLLFIRVPEGKTVKNRVHLDLTTTDLDSESCTPCDSSETVSLSGQRVAAIRARSASISASGISILNGRIAGASVDSSVVIDTSASSVCGSM
jgi:Glyoxalase-like domain